MTNLRRNILTYLAAFCAVCVMAACTTDNGSKETAGYDALMRNDSIPQVVKNVVKAIYENDAALFAKEVGYPLQRPYPLKDIQNEAEMKDYYGIIVDDSLRNVVVNSGPEDWQKYGWRGYSLDDGFYIWVDESVYAVDYVSGKERQIIDSLLRVEKNSLPSQIRNGWEPVLTLISDDGANIYRIDRKVATEADSAPLYRLSVYDLSGDKVDLGKMPETLLEGHIEIEGSASVVSYVFPQKDGKEYVIYPDDPTEGTPTMTLPDGTEKTLRKQPWHELLSE